MTKGRSPSKGKPSANRGSATKRGDAKLGAVSAIAAVLFMAAGSAWVWSCSKEEVSPAPVPTVSANRGHAVPSTVEPGAPVLANAQLDAGADATEEEVDAGPWEGPWVGALVPTAPVYSAMFRTRENMVGYLRHGTRAPAADTKPLKKDNCKQGWYRLHPHGYICGRHATPDLGDARFQSGITPPDLDSTVPYKYARNPKNGTPLYRRIPTREEMATYEPDRQASASKAKSAAKEAARIKDKDAGKKAGRDAKSKKRPGKEDASTLAASASAIAAALSALPPVASLDAGLPPLPPLGADVFDAGLRTTPVEEDAGLLDAADEPKPWWLREDSGEDLRMDHMFEGADEVLAMRMARGFYVAVDKTFRKNGRLWHKTTDGLIAPADKVSINSPPTFHGVELTGPEAPSLPVGWTRVKASKHFLSEDGKKFRSKGTMDRFSLVPLTGKTKKHGGKEYRETKGGWWVRSSQIGVTDPGPPPSGLRTKERWIDVNLTTQTLVAFEGSEAVYATMISTGKKGQTKKTDHSTVKGAFRVREKHVAAKMDGDGAGPGEGPYSIRDVPYVLYFERSYAIHGAFWHNSFGTRMSHGCVNLAPLDAKWLFFWSAPFIPEGWHGMWSSKDNPGSFVVVHD